MRGLVVIGLLGTVAGTLVNAAALAADTPAAKAGLQGLRDSLSKFPGTEFC